MKVVITIIVTVASLILFQSCDGVDRDTRYKYINKIALYKALSEHQYKTEYTDSIIKYETLLNR